MILLIFTTVPVTCKNLSCKHIPYPYDKSHLPSKYSNSSQVQGRQLPSPNDSIVAYPRSRSVSASSNGALHCSTSIGSRSGSTGAWKAPRVPVAPPRPVPDLHGRWVSSGGNGLRVRGGAANGAPQAPGAKAPLAMFSSASAEAVKAPVEKFRRDYKPPGHWTRYGRHLFRSPCLRLPS